MRTFLPKTGAGRAAVATVMGGMFLIDGVKALSSGAHEASAANNRQELNQAATNFGNHMGMFAFDMAAGGYIGLKAEKLTGRIMENPVGAAQKVGGLADSIVGRFSKSAPAAEGEAAAATYASRLTRAVESRELPDRNLLPGDKKVERFWTSDDSKVGNFLNRTPPRKSTAGLRNSRSRKSRAAKNPLANIPPEQSQSAHGTSSAPAHRSGRFAHGLSPWSQRSRRRISRIRSHIVTAQGGLNPEQIKASEPVPDVPDLHLPKLDAALAGHERNKRTISKHQRSDDQDRRWWRRHCRTQKTGSRTCRRTAPASLVKYTHDTAPGQVKADGELNVANLQKMAQVTAEERALITPGRHDRNCVQEPDGRSGLQRSHDQCRQNPTGCGTHPARQNNVCTWKKK